MKKGLLAAACLLALVGKSQAADLSLGLGADYWNPTPEGQIAGLGRVWRPDAYGVNCCEQCCFMDPL